MVSTYIRGATPTRIFLGTCPKCVRPWRHVEDDDRRSSDYINGHCPDCLGEVRYERVYGTVTGMQCDPRCEGAYGPHCDCACGGINHGGVWSGTGEILAGALQKYRDDIARREAERQARADAKARERKSEWDHWYEANKTVVDWLLGTDWYSLDRPDGFLGSLREQVEDQHKTLSPRQLECAERSMARRAQWDAARRDREAHTTEVPEGRQTVEGIIVGTYWKDNPFSRSPDAQTLCIIVDCGNYTVSGTCPSAFDSAIFDNTGLKGKQVKFSAELKPGKEKGRGWFKRPTKAEFVTAA